MRFLTLFFQGKKFAAESGSYSEKTQKDSYHLKTLATHLVIFAAEQVLIGYVLSPAVKNLQQ